MYDFMLNNSIYLVLAIFLIGIAGIFAYLLRMNGRLSQLEKQAD